MVAKKPTSTGLVYILPNSRPLYTMSINEQIYTPWASFFRLLFEFKSEILTKQYHFLFPI